MITGIYHRTRPIKDWTDEQLHKLKENYLSLSSETCSQRHRLSVNQLRDIASRNRWIKTRAKSLTSTETEKECSKCRITKSVSGNPAKSEFNRKNGGFQAYCKSCKKKTRLKIRTEFNPIHHSPQQQYV